MTVGDPSLSESPRKSISVELRIGPRARDRAHIDDQIHVDLPDQSDKFVDRARRMVDREHCWHRLSLLHRVCHHLPQARSFRVGALHFAVRSPQLISPEGSAAKVAGRRRDIVHRSFRPFLRNRPGRRDFIDRRRMLIGHRRLWGCQGRSVSSPGNDPPAQQDRSFELRRGSSEDDA